MTPTKDFKLESILTSEAERKRAVKTLRPITRYVAFAQNYEVSGRFKGECLLWENFEMEFRCYLLGYSTSLQAVNEAISLFSTFNPLRAPACIRATLHRIQQQLSANEWHGLMPRFMQAVTNIHSRFSMVELASLIRVNQQPE